MYKIYINFIHFEIDKSFIKLQAHNYKLHTYYIIRMKLEWNSSELIILVWILLQLFNYNSQTNSSLWQIIFS